MELANRLHMREKNATTNITKRLMMAKNDISHWREYDYVVINHTIDICVEHVHGILKAERLKQERQLGLRNFVNTLTPPQEPYEHIL